MNLNSVVRKRFSKIKRSRFSLFMDIYCRERAKETSRVQPEHVPYWCSALNESLCSVLDHFLKSILVDLKDPLSVRSKAMSICGCSLQEDYIWALEFLSFFKKNSLLSQNSHCYLSGTKPRVIFFMWFYLLLEVLEDIIKEIFVQCVTLSSTTPGSIVRTMKAGPRSQVSRVSTITGIWPHGSLWMYSSLSDSALHSGQSNELGEFVLSVCQEGQTDGYWQVQVR